MKYYIIAGEASGDLHAANLVMAMNSLTTEQGKNIYFRGVGGDLMMKQGVSLLRHYRETAFMGFIEVIMHLRKILGFIDECKKDILQWQPDAIILVDYPGFNLRIAQFAHQKGFRVFYYISPQVWAWKASRVEKIKRDVDRMFVILPFEKNFYLRRNYDVDFVGHPLLDEINRRSIESHDQYLDDYQANSKPLITLFPGSRKQEIEKMLSVMLEVVNSFPEYQFAVAGVNSIDEKFYRSIIGDKNCALVFDQAYTLLSKATAALVTSGTATLETALFNVPQVVCYRGSRLSYFIARRLVNVKYIALVNLILDSPLVKELIQHEFNAGNLKTELQNILFNDEKRKEIQNGYAELKTLLGGSGASVITAKKILELTL